MSPEELVKSLHSLDALYIQKDSFRAWLSGNIEAGTIYEQVKQRVENAFPGLHVVYVDVTFKHTHALIASD